MPLISVIVPIYKTEKYLNRCIDSILNQTFTNFELILVDDGSPDNCGKICDEYAKKDNRINVIHKENGGPSDARNAGIEWAFENSDSEWISFIDSDDWVHIYYFELLYKTAVNNNVILSSCGYEKVKERCKGDKKTINAPVDIDTPENILKKGYKNYEYNLSTPWGRLYSKELFKNIRYPYGRFYEDEFTTYKLVYACDKIAIINTPLYYYFQNEAGAMASSLTLKKLKDRFDACKEETDFFYKNGYAVAFERYFNYYCYMVRKYNIEFSQNKAYKDVLKLHAKYIKNKLNIYNRYLPKQAQNYSFKKWIKGKDVIIKNFQKDIDNVKKEKGFLFSILWAIKNYWKQ